MKDHPRHVRKRLLGKMQRDRPLPPIIPVRRRVPVLNIAPGVYEAWISVARVAFLNDPVRARYR